MTRRRRQSAAAAAVAALVLAAGVVAVNVAGAQGAPVAAQGDGEAPGALGGHLERLRQAVPGDMGMAPEGPGSAADAEFAKRAYPNGTISIAQMDAARSAFTTAYSREVDVKHAAVNAWAGIGPSRALYPLTEYRDAFSYVPAEYVASGRTTSIAISSVCEPLNCRAWVTPAGGGVWGTLDILAAEPRWSYFGGPLGINAAGSVTVDPNDPSGATIYVGTGEANICGSGCVAGVGIYKSTDGGATWTGPIGKDELGGKGIGAITIVPGDSDTMYAATTTALRGMSSVCCSGVTRPVPDAAQWGLYKTTNGGDSWAFIHNGSEDATECTGSADEFANLATCSPRGVRDVQLDPGDSDTVYAGSYARGIWRSRDAGATWTQIKESLDATLIQTRPSFDVTELPSGDTRMYVHEGNVGVSYSRLFRSDDVATGNPTFENLTSANPGDPGFATYNQCGGQCWYDLFVHSPEGYPDIVYTGGSYAYGETIANKRAVVLSTDAGVTGTDMTYDGTDELHPNGIHPDQHALVTNPNDPYQFFEAGDGGVVRSSGDFVNRSSWCDDPRRNLVNPGEEKRCEQMLSRIPSRLTGINTGLSTLQFIGLSVSPHDRSMLQGGTQDNGTWENFGETTQWTNTMIGDGGASGFDAKREDFRFHNFYDASTEVNFENGDIADWIWTADPIFGQAGTQFYAPVISDPRVGGTMFAGTGTTAYRTTTYGLGDRTIEEANEICNSWTGTFAETCGDWAELGPDPLTGESWGDRAGGAVSAVERTPASRNAAWAATSTGRVFISKNVATENPEDATWTRIDKGQTSPNRFVTSIYVHPNKANRAWVTYSGFDSATPDTPGHVFKVRYKPGNGKASWKDLSFDLGDLPISDIVRDTKNSDIYISNDFGILRRPAGLRTWAESAPGLPNVEVAGLTMDVDRRILYAASHGLGAWKLDLRE